MHVMKIFAETGNDWEETFYRMLTRYFGFRVNTEPFEMLATALPFKDNPQTFRQQVPD